MSKTAFLAKPPRYRFGSASLATVVFGAAIVTVWPGNLPDTTDVLSGEEAAAVAAMSDHEPEEAVPDCVTSLSIRLVALNCCPSRFGRCRPCRKRMRRLNKTSMRRPKSCLLNPTR